MGAPGSTTRHILLVTGTPGVGKTTLMRKLARRLEGKRVGGFYTEEIREDGVRKGFRLVTFAGEEGIMAHVDLDHRHSVGKYGVDVGVVDRLSESTLTIAEDIDLYIVDEIGKMECLSSRFIARVRALLDSDKTLVATVAKKGGGLIDEVKRRPECALMEVTRSNRDALASDILSWLRERV